MAEQILTAKMLREIISYDHESGLLRWINAGKGVKAGAIAGHLAGSGYTAVRIHRKPYQAHRIAWLHFHGHWPTGAIDHINGARSDNRIANLRDVSTEVNTQNRRGPSKNNKLGVLGVWRHGKGFETKIWVGKKCIRLGTHPTVEMAQDKYMQAKRSMHEGCTI